MARIIVVDDNETVRDGMAIALKKLGHEVVAAAGGETAVAAYRKAPADFVITDLKMAPMDGAELLKTLRGLDPEAMVMVVTAYGTIEAAVEAMKLGAFDFLTKPFTPDVLRAKVEKALEVRGLRQRMGRLEAQNAALREADDERLGDMIGESQAMREVFAAIEKLAPADAPVHVQGESGTGKELVARAIHRLSPRRDGPFVKVNCGALAETLLESELFGHERGAFTGAIKRKLGRFELADGGTLFLDEIGDIGPALQVKLLRVLQEGEFERVGGETTLRVDARVVSATHRDLRVEVAEGRFREDLFYRLHVLPLRLPALRERGDDLLLIARHHARRVAARMGRTFGGFAPEAERLMRRYGWPGNVRELENAVEQALVFAEGPRVDVADLPAFLQDGRRGPALALPTGTLSLPEILEDLERQLIERAYLQADGVKTETARLLGIKPSALYYKLDKYGIGDRAGRGDADAEGGGSTA